MADITTGNTINASDLNTLKTNILTMYNNRKVEVDNQQLSSSSNTHHAAVANASFTAGESITANDLGALLKACLVINDIPNLLKDQDQGVSIFSDGSTTAINDWVNQRKSATSTNSTHGCRGACVGICTGGCSGTTRGSTGGSSGTACSGCTTGCWSSCSGGNGSGAGGMCDCANSCYSGCYGSCKGDSCKHDCSGTCGGGCGEQCYHGCQTACQNTCKNGCATDCTSGCYGLSKSGNYT